MRDGQGDMRNGHCEGWKSTCLGYQHVQTVEKEWEKRMWMERERERLNGTGKDIYGEGIQVYNQNYDARK